MGSFTDVLRAFVEKALFSQAISSANPTHVNKTDSVDINPGDFDRILETEIDKAISSSPQAKSTNEKMTEYESGNVEKIQNLSSKAFSNVSQIAHGPFAFISSIMTRQLAKAVTGVGIALIIMQFVNFAIDEAMKPGRFLDRRFRRLASDEILQFITHQEQEKLRRGFTEVRVTTQGGLRGGASQVSGNLFQHQSISGTLGSPTEYKQDAVIEEQGGPVHPYSNVDADGNPVMPRRIR